jgi:hypothetical protein
VVDCPSIEGVWNRGDRVPDIFIAGCSQNSTATLTNCTGGGNCALNGGGFGKLVVASIRGGHDISS